MHISECQGVVLVYFVYHFHFFKRAFFFIFFLSSYNKLTTPNFEENCFLRQVKLVKLVNKKRLGIAPWHSITCTQSYRSFENKSTNEQASLQNKKSQIQQQLIPALVESSRHMSCLWKQSPDEMFHQKTFAKTPYFVWFQVEDLNISDIFYRTQNFI